ncbi:hypothetical protein RBA41_24220 [Massilia sp. CCM 9210]|uniref:hypothetical protein n=1 Tax=Massilia scottii TaxID=3057166 RepID=UPI002796B951|nr:hypothetical protein [Massilia sp. CCM 9210]MDQ1816408.1 hypothetical protein [Massilia sp. CCM 9210]
MTLPPQLAPWSEWLALVPLEMAEPLGQMLLRLQPLVGRMTGVAASPDTIPVGAGSIARRGPYQRLLLSEWAVLDAAPDEFIRRASANELLFSAPEPQVQRRARLCVALFDAGPEQLGEPRLVQMALMILLARRAGEAGADFQWGVLQAPPTLHAKSRKLRAWLDARTLTRVDAAHLKRWNEELGSLGETDEVWQIGASGCGALARTGARVNIEAPLFDAGLKVSITQRRATRELLLELPAPGIGARLLRHPFDPPPQGKRRVDDMLSLKQAPVFGLSGTWLAAAREKGGVVLHHVPASAAAQPGKPRRYHAKPRASVLGVVLAGKMPAMVEISGSSLTFVRFPGREFGPPRTVMRRRPDQFRMPSETGCWLPTFFLIDYSRSSVGARVFMRDLGGKLGCWTACSPEHLGRTRFHQVDEGVTGAIQYDRTLLYATSAANRTTIYAIGAKEEEPTEIAEFPMEAMRVLFGAPAPARQRASWLYALQRSDQHWLLVDDNFKVTIPLMINDGATVMGVARMAPQACTTPALLVLSADRRTVDLRSASGNQVVLQSEQPIAQLVLDPTGERLCWLTDSRELSVRALHGSEVLLHVASAPERGAA